MIEPKNRIHSGTKDRAMNIRLLLHKKEKEIKVVFGIKGSSEEERGSLPLSLMVRWFELISNHNLVVRL